MSDCLCCLWPVWVKTYEKWRILDSQRREYIPEQILNKAIRAIIRCAELPARERAGAIIIFERADDAEKQFNQVKEYLTSISKTGAKWAPVLKGSHQVNAQTTVNGWKLLSYKEMRLCDLIPHLKAITGLLLPDCFENLSRWNIEKLDVESTYEPWLRREQAHVRAFGADENLLLPNNFRYLNTGNLKLSNEVCQLLNTIQPKTIGQARRIQGVTPAAIFELFKLVRGNQKKIANALR